MRRLKIANLDTQLTDVVDSTLNGLLLASVLRYFALGGAVYIFVTVPVIESVVPSLILFTISFIAHNAVCPYMGFKLFSFRRLIQSEDFVPLPPWIMPAYDIEELSGSEYQAITDATTKQEHLELK